MSARTCAHCGGPVLGNPLCIVCAARCTTGTLDMIRRNICTLVGPTAHYEAFDAASVELGKLGWLVFTVGSHRTDDRGLETTDEERKIYWRTHREKMDISSMVFVVDLPHPDAPAAMGRVGTDTAAEIVYAKDNGLDIAYMSRTWPSSLPRVPEGGSKEDGGAPKEEAGKEATETTKTTSEPAAPPPPDENETEGEGDADEVEEDAAERPPTTPTTAEEIDAELKRIEDEINECYAAIGDLDGSGNRLPPGRGMKNADDICRRLDDLFTRRGALNRRRVENQAGAAGSG